MGGAAHRPGGVRHARAQGKVPPTAPRISRLWNRCETFRLFCAGEQFLVLDIPLLLESARFLPYLSYVLVVSWSVHWSHAICSQQRRRGLGASCLTSGPVCFDLLSTEHAPVFSVLCDTLSCVLPNVTSCIIDRSNRSATGRTLSAPDRRSRCLPSCISTAHLIAHPHCASRECLSQ